MSDIMSRWGLDKRESCKSPRAESSEKFLLPYRKGGRTVSEWVGRRVLLGAFLNHLIVWVVRDKALSLSLSDSRVSYCLSDNNKTDKQTRES